MGDETYIENLPSDITAETIGQIFGSIGFTVVQAEISTTGINTCAASVKFQSAAEAKSVLETFNGATLPGFDKPLRISYNQHGGAAALAAGVAAALMAAEGGCGGGAAGGYGKGGGYGKAAAHGAMLGMQGSMQPYAPAKTGDPDNLYIKGLPGTADEAFVEQLFNQYGTVRQCKVMKKSNDQPTCHAMVRFATAEDAATVIGTLNGGMLEGFSTPLEITYLVYKPKGAGKGGNAPTSGDPETQHLLDEWLKAKRTRDFGTADAIRAQLRAQGVDPDKERPKWDGAEDMSSMK
jgi:RNA recognition motif-containing protein